MDLLLHACNKVRKYSYIHLLASDSECSGSKYGHKRILLFTNCDNPHELDSSKQVHTLFAARAYIIFSLFFSYYYFYFFLIIISAASSKNKSKGWLRFNFVIVSLVVFN